MSGSGSTSPAAGTHSYEEDTEVNVTAYPTSGWMLDHWLLDSVDVGNANPYKVTMDDNHTLTAVFAEKHPIEVDSCNSTGAIKDVFDLDEEVWVKGNNFEASSLVDVYAVEDATAWTDGLNISSLTIMSTNIGVSTEADGELLPTQIWTTSLQLGEYDIIIDVNRNGIYDEGIDALDDMDVQDTAGFIVIPETPLATFITLLAITISLLIHKNKPKWKNVENSTFPEK